jgi:hypothetical protein
MAYPAQVLGCLGVLHWLGRGSDRWEAIRQYQGLVVQIEGYSRWIGHLS